MTVLRNVEWESTSDSVLIDILLCLSGHSKKGANNELNKQISVSQMTMIY